MDRVVDHGEGRAQGDLGLGLGRVEARLDLVEDAEPEGEAVALCLLRRLASPPRQLVVLADEQIDQVAVLEGEFDVRAQQEVQALVRDGGAGERRRGLPLGRGGPSRRPRLPATTGAVTPEMIPQPSSPSASPSTGPP
ncbi:hypothetical protein ACFC0C_35625 [Streptomyces sp. NPDC056178]|uniref:hypothetical protein n=1 Tax=Streptomyces sp. NPDC056178 TaxID=3345735 RepID=UPI0035D6BB77